MHSSQFKSCTVFHHGDYSGGVIISNESTEVEAIKGKARLDTSMVELLKVYRKGFRQGLNVNSASVVTLWHRCQDPEHCHENSPKIAIYFSDLEKFICSALESRIINAIESQTLGYTTLMNIMKKVGARPLDE